jgi:hypothetical protein
MYFPLAAHEVVDVQLTPVSQLAVAPAGLGVESTDHAVPFHERASVFLTPDESR